MVRATKTLRTCEKGHKYYKSSDCPTCPTCEAQSAPDDGLLSKLAAPARRALEKEGITTTEKLSAYTEKKLLKLHGVGPNTIPKLRDALKEAGRTFANE